MTKELLARASQQEDLTVEEIASLAQLKGRDMWAMLGVADELRSQQCGDEVSYVINRNINFTNVCIKQCSFCAFSRGHREEQGYYLPDSEIFRRIDEAVQLGATEICVQAGLPPKMEGDLYIRLTEKIKSSYPDLHLHAFSPEEILYGCIRSKRTPREYLKDLKAAGLDSLPGTSAEILVQSVRDHIAPGRINVEQWLEILTTAHELEIPTTSTIMFGHVETVEHWAQHLVLLRELQFRTGGLTEFVPLSFVHQEAPMIAKGKVTGVRGGATGYEVAKMHALGRIVLGHHLKNIQASWVKEGPKLAQLLLDSGCNDLGGTLINESISTSAGASFGQLVTPRELRRIITDAGRTPFQRNTLYQRLENTDTEALNSVNDADSRFGSYRALTVSDEHRYQHPFALHQ